MANTKVGTAGGLSTHSTSHSTLRDKPSGSDSKSSVQAGSGQGKKLAFRKEAQERIASDKFSLILFFLCVLAISGQAALILTAWGKLPPQIPLYYSRPWGEQLLASPYALWTLPILAAAFLVLNFFIAFFMLKDNIFLLRVLVSFAFVTSFAAFYDVLKIVSLLI